MSSSQWLLFKTFLDVNSFITSANEPTLLAFVCLFVCLSVLATLRKKTTEQFFMKILTQLYLWTRQNWLNFGSHPPLYSDPAIFWRILGRCEIGHFFPKLIHISGKTYRIFTNILPELHLWIRTSPLNTGSYPDPDSGHTLTALYMAISTWTSRTWWSVWLRKVPCSAFATV